MKRVSPPPALNFYPTPPTLPNPLPSLTLSPNFVSSKEPGPESPSSPIAPPCDASSTVCEDGIANFKGSGEGGGGSEGGGSNMVSRDDTAAMHRLVGRWLQREAEELADRAAECAVGSSAERVKILRALMRCVCVLATFFRLVSIY